MKWWGAAIDCLLMPKGGAFWIVTILLGIAAAAVFIANDVQNRQAIDAAIGRKVAHVPERMFLGYGKTDLETFKSEALKAKIGSTNETALDRYISPTLLWWDVVFAVLMAGFSAMAVIGLAPHVPWLPYSTYIALLAVTASILYGIFDVMEDLTLASLLDPKAQMDDRVVSLASGLTIFKMVTLTLSVAGGLLFVAILIVGVLMTK